MTQFDWDEYSANSGTEDVPLLLSERSQQLILAAMEVLQGRSSWLPVDDATWDDIDAAIGEAYEEITEEQAVVLNQQQFGVFLRSVDQNLAAATFTPIAFTEVSPPQFADDNGWMIQPACTDFILPEAGYYRMAVTAAFGTLATSQLRLLRFDIDGVAAAQVNMNTIGNPALSMENVFHISASATVQVHAYSAQASIIDNSFPARFSITRLYNGDY